MKDGVFLAGEGIVIGADPVEFAVDIGGRSPRRALEDHVLEEVRHAGDVGRFVARSGADKKPTAADFAGGLVSPMIVRPFGRVCWWKGMVILNSFFVGSCKRPAQPAPRSRCKNLWPDNGPRDRECRGASTRRLPSEFLPCYEPARIVPIRSQRSGPRRRRFLGHDEGRLQPRTNAIQLVVFDALSQSLQFAERHVQCLLRAHSAVVPA